MKDKWVIIGAIGIGAVAVLWFAKATKANGGAPLVTTGDSFFVPSEFENSGDINAWLANAEASNPLRRFIQWANTW